jgi:hypothetical protein
MNLGFKILTTDNWLQPDPTASVFVKISHGDGSVTPVSGQDWATQFLSPTLAEDVPKDVRALFEVARGSMVYGYFFYPLYALAVEQLFRVAEAAVSMKCKSLGAPEKLWKFQDTLKYLVDRKVITEHDRSEWDAIRGLRNEASHPKQQTILPPGLAASLLARMADRINSLFS